MNYIACATSLHSFLKAYKTKKKKGFFLHEWFDCPKKMKNKELPPYDSFFSILRNSNPLEKNYHDFQSLVNSGLTTEQAVAKLRMNRILPTGADNYSSFLLSIRFFVLLSLHVKLYWMKLLYTSRQTCANELLVSMLVSFIPTPCANQCQLDCIRNRSTILKLRDSQLAKTNLSPLRKWFCHTFNEVDQIAK